MIGGRRSINMFNSTYSRKFQVQNKMRLKSLNKNPKPNTLDLLATMDSVKPKNTYRVSSMSYETPQTIKNINVIMLRYM